MWVFVLTCTLEDAGVAMTVSLSEGLHHSVNLLRLTRQTETPEKLSAKGRTGQRRHVTALQADLPVTS